MVLVKRSSAQADHKFVNVNAPANAAGSKSDALVTLCSLSLREISHSFE
jgi:hypothetical protein